MENNLLLSSITALSVTLALLIGLAWLAKRFGPRLGLPISSTTKNKRIHVLEKTPLTPQTTLHLIQIDDTEHLLATTAAQTTVISSTKVKKSAKV